MLGSKGFVCQTNPTKQGPLWHSVVRRRVIDESSETVLFDEDINPQKGKACYHHPGPSDFWHIRTEFWFRPQEISSTLDSLPTHYVRQLKSQVRQLEKRSDNPLNPVQAESGQLHVAEVFCPPRFAPLVTGVGGRCDSYDLITGYDLSQASVRAHVSTP